jgi:hypothetical protein
VPSAGQGFNYWAIDRLGFDQEFLGVLAQVGAVLSLVGLIVFRKPITHRPVSYTLFWVTIAGAVLYLPTIGLFYGVNEWFGVSPRTFAFIDTTISARWASSAWYPCSRSSRPRRAGGATMFAIMASLMNRASASKLGTRYSALLRRHPAGLLDLGRLLICVGLIGLLPLLALPLLRREEAEAERA